MNETQTLRMLLQEAADVRDLSGRGLADLATSNGFNLNRSTVSRILKGTYVARPAADTIRAIAWLAGVSERVAFEAAGRPQPGPSFAEELPEDADLLTPRERRVIVELVRLMIDNRLGDADDEEQESWTQESGAEHSGAGRGARRPGAPIAADPTKFRQAAAELGQRITNVVRDGEPVGEMMHDARETHHADKDQALLEADQGSQADHELAARKGETEDEIRERLGIPYE
ncbi:hypothetical protein [Rhodococcoides fascians]|uniref:hypothetical protein n=1 Tax=Rhodococcoides fascians TaxID=1828 RepID=UPI0012D2A2B1|nr:hypothetical protein [Rhodococcus fascians]